MNWYWQVRIYNQRGNYASGEVKTERNLKEISIIQDFYFDLTGCKMLIEGMRETSNKPNILPISEAFTLLYGKDQS